MARRKGVRAKGRRVRVRVREGTDEPRWVTRQVLDAIHHAQLREHGGSDGVRDDGMLESALARPRNKFAYGEADLCALAAAYAFGIAKNHGYVDGNKRTAFQAAYMFLGLNGMEIIAPEPEAVDMMNRLAAAGMTEPAFAKWLRESSQPLSRDD